MLMVLCIITIFIHTNTIPIRQKIYLILAEYHSEHNVYAICLGRDSNHDLSSESPSCEPLYYQATQSCRVTENY